MAEPQAGSSGDLAHERHYVGRVQNELIQVPAEWHIATVLPARTGHTSCSATTLSTGASFTGTIQAGTCALRQSTVFSGGSFTGPESEGNYFYNLYTVDLAGNTVGTISVVRGTLPPYARL